MSKIRTLFLTFFKIGAFTFGGGYAMSRSSQVNLSKKRNGSAATTS